MNDFELFTKRASIELERIFKIEPYSDDLVVTLGSWRANHNREAMVNFIKKNRNSIIEIEGSFEDIINHLITLVKNALLSLDHFD